MTFTMFPPGTFVRHPDQPDWGLGQVQSAVGSRVTVNFEHVGKVVVLIDRVDLQVEEEARPPVVD